MTQLMRFLKVYTHE